jgi:hypothetical protein
LPVLACHLSQILQFIGEQSVTVKLGSSITGKFCVMCSKKYDLQSVKSRHYTGRSANLGSTTNKQSLKNIDTTLQKDAVMILNALQNK